MAVAEKRKTDERIQFEHGVALRALNSAERHISDCESRLLSAVNYRNDIAEEYRRACEEMDARSLPRQLDRKQ